MINFNRCFVLLMTCYLFAFSKAEAQQDCPIIPQPNRAVKTQGVFIFDQSVKIVGSKNFLPLINHFTTVLQEKIGYQAAEKKNDKTIQLVLTRGGLNHEAYQIHVSSNTITVKASNETGLANGLTSLAQLIINYNTGKISKIPNWKIEDEPRFEWRGFMLDESRHFFGAEKVKQILDWMAYYKLNKFHWHLTDEQGWRLAIAQYPKLATIGGIGNHSDKNAPAKFYSQAQIRDIVQYAAQRYIEVIPEIDMPGHATAANSAYPEFSGGGTPEHPEFTFNPGKEATYTYLTNILKEVKALFKSDKIHLGADEVAFGAKAWETNEDVKQIMAKHQLNNILEVENYFIKRMADSIKTLNAKVLAWDEALSANLDQNNTILFWWRHDKPQQLEQALSRGYAVVVCPRLPLYLDFVQDQSHKLGRKWNGKFNRLLDIYQFPGNASFADNPLVKGLQGNLWTETIYNEERLDFMIFPRLAAVASAGWTKQENKNEAAFIALIKNELKLYKKQGIYYFDPFNEQLPKKLENPSQKNKTEYVDPFVKETKFEKQN